MLKIKTAAKTAVSQAFILSRFFRLSSIPTKLFPKYSNFYGKNHKTAPNNHIFAHDFNPPP
jgi:hypothetical protein